MTKPTLVGGLPVKTLDFIPSILFACLYAVTLLFMGYNVCFKKGSRTWVLVGTLSFVIERIILFSLRAVESTNTSGTEEERGEQGSNEYMQATLSLGMAVITNDILAMLGSLLLASTYATPEDNPALRAIDRQRLAEEAKDVYQLEAKDSSTTAASHEREDDVQRRKKYGIRTLGMHLIYGAIQGLGAYGNTAAVSQKDEKDTLKNQALRYTPTALVLLINLWMLGSVLRWRIYNKWPAHVKRTSMIQYLVPLNFLLAIPAIYRLAVMHYTTPSHPLVSASDKTLFYVFHIVPEWIVCVMFCLINVRKEFLTGAFGDGHGKAVETPEQKEKRLERECESFGDRWRRMRSKKNEAQ